MILIISKIADATTNEVIDWLNFYTAKWRRVNFKYLLQQKWSISICDKFEINYNQEDISNNKTIWYRKSDRPSLKDYIKNEYFDPKLDDRIDDFLRQELTYLFSTLRSLKNDEPYWLNHPLNNQSDKLKALKNAKDSKLMIPPSLVTNTKEELIFFRKKHKEIICKPVQATFYYADETYSYSMLTRIVTQEVIADLGDVFFPSFFQTKIDKEYEIRSFFIEGIFYSMAIFSQNDPKTKLDFRNYNLKKFNRWVPYQLPIDIEKKLTMFMTKMEMNSGSLDLIKGLDGQYYFLEVNPVGQLGMVSKFCGYNLEKKIAQVLIYEEEQKENRQRH